MEIGRAWASSRVLLDSATVLSGSSAGRVASVTLSVLIYKVKRMLKVVLQRAGFRFSESFEMLECLKSIRPRVHLFKAWVYLLFFLGLGFHAILSRTRTP